MRKKDIISSQFWTCARDLGDMEAMHEVGTELRHVERLERDVAEGHREVENGSLNIVF